VRLAARLWPRTLAGRTILVLLAGLSVFHLGSVWLHERAVHGAALEARERQVAERLAAAKRAVAALPPQERDATAQALSSAGLDVHWSPRAAVREGAPDVPDATLGALRERLLRLVPELGALRLGYADEGGHVGGHLIVGAMRLPDESWLNFAAPVFRPAPAEAAHASLASLSAMALGIVLASILVVRWLTRPLRRLAEAADRFGRGGAPVPLPEEGPSEVHDAARAFNAMQARIHRLVEDRTQALAAVSHDLRTPITRLRLRVGFLEDAEAQARMDADLDEMEAMVAATLAYLRGEEGGEPRKRADLAAMLRTLVDDAADAGRVASYDGPSHAELECRPLGLKRAFANLVGNALGHGGAARVALREEAGALTVTVSDDGPGIPEAELERVFEPFRRLDASRSRATGGVGLGLAIARRAIEAEGGGVILRNRPGGGLDAVVTLPCGGGGA
jgi:signal transduction histidine kinase